MTHSNMPSSDSGSSGQRPKPSTRSSIRHSLNLASMSKAISDAINKDTKGDGDKNAKKAVKETRRLSAINLKAPAIPRTSIGGDIKPSSQTLGGRKSLSIASPDSKTVTRRRVSGATQQSSSDELGVKPRESLMLQGSSIQKSSSLRPRPGASSGLPKYRPKSIIQDSTRKPPSPTRAGTRRRFSISEDDKEEDKTGDMSAMPPSPSEKSARPISPLPQRATVFKVNLTSAVNATIRTTPTKLKAPAPTAKASPSRPTKVIKTTAIPRPPSSSSSSGSFTPRTPTTPTTRSLLRTPLSGKEKKSPSRPALPESPLARHSRKGSKSSSNSTPAAEANTTARNMSHISEGDSEDAEEEDVEHLLAPVAALGAPTPAMPRLQKPRARQKAPQTPTRSSRLPTRADLSYLSPLPPDSDKPSSLRPQPSPNSGAPRGSILSWDQLTNDASRTLSEDDLEKMLSEVPAPFHSGAVSPIPGSMLLEVPESPCLSAMSSPGGYGSISQVLLPDVTPSPAVHHHHSQRYHGGGPSNSDFAVDSATVTLLRLEIARAENDASKRLIELQTLEEEVHHLRQARLRDAEELSRQVGYLEDQMRGSLEARERTEEDSAAYTASLEDQLRHAQAYRDEAVDSAITHAQKKAKAARQDALKKQGRKWERACTARAAAISWNTVHGLAKMELDTVQGDVEVLLALQSQLDLMEAHLGDFSSPL